MTRSLEFAFKVSFLLLQPHEKAHRSMTCSTRRRRATGKTGRFFGLSSSTPPFAAWLVACAVVVLFLLGEISALMCYQDMDGVHTTDHDDPVDTNKFKIRNCTHNGTGKIEKVSKPEDEEWPV